MASRPSLHIDTAGEHAVVTLVGEFDLDVADALRDALGVAVHTRQRVVVDLSNTEFLDSMTLGCLVMAAKMARTAGGWLRLAGPSRSIRRVLVITGLDSVIPVYATVEDAAALPPEDLLVAASAI